MKRPALSVYLLSLLVILSLASAIPKGHSTTYAPGVKVGDWANYAVTTYWSSNDPSLQEPEPIAQVHGASSVMVTITGVAADIVTGTEVWTFVNNTQPRTVHVQGSVLDGSGNITELVIASGLSPGDRFSTNAPFTINYTSVGTYAGTFRSINTFNFSFALGTVSDFAALQWERYSGLSVESMFSFTANIAVGPIQYNARGLADIKMAQSSITHTPPDFSITGDTSASLTAGASGNVTLTLHSQDGFAGNVQVTATTGQTGAAITTQPAQIRVPVDGQASTKILLTSNSAQTYTVNVILSAGPISHLRTETYTVNAAPTSTPPPTAQPKPQPASFLGLQPVQLYTIIGIVAAAILAVTAVAVARARKQKPPTQTPWFTPPPTTPSPPAPTEQPSAPTS